MSLRFNPPVLSEITICDPSDNISTYGIINENLAKVDKIEQRIPGTLGSFFFETGTSQTEASSVIISVTGITYGLTLNNINNIISAIETAMDTSGEYIGTLSYTHPNDTGSQVQLTNMLFLEFKPSMIRQIKPHSSMNYVMEFTATFRKVEG